MAGRRHCLRHRSSSHGRDSAARTPRCGRVQARRGGEDSARQPPRAAPTCHETPPGPSPAGALGQEHRLAAALPPTCTRGSSGDASAHPSGRRLRPGRGDRFLRRSTSLPPIIEDSTCKPCNRFACKPCARFIRTWRHPRESGDPFSRPFEANGFPLPGNDVASEFDFCGALPKHADGNNISSLI